MIVESSFQLSNWLQEHPGANLYFVGIGGCGMNGLAHLAMDAGFQVAGSDLQAKPALEALKARGAEVSIGHSKRHMESFNPELMVLSSAIPEDNPQFESARSSMLPIVHRAALLGALTRHARSLCVAGMHGKTTTASLLAFALQSLEAPMSHAIGGNVAQLVRRGNHIGSAKPAQTKLEGKPFMVVETDESDGSLLQFEPDHAICLNIDQEHMDYYGSMDEVVRVFNQFSNQIKGNSIYCIDDQRLRSMFQARQGAISYGFSHDAVFQIESHKAASSLRPYHAFELKRGRQPLGSFEISLCGEENVLNATAVVALLFELGFDLEAIRLAIKNFKGADRRQQKVFEGKHHVVIDDYGHHPTEIKSTLKSIKPLVPGRLLVAFQPHRFTRSASLMGEFLQCFENADKLWLTDIYAAHELPLPGISSQTMVDELKERGVHAAFHADLETLPDTIQGELKKGDWVVFFGAGSITNYAWDLSENLKRKEAMDSIPQVDSLKVKLSDNSLVKTNEPLGPKTTLKVGGNADFFVQPTSKEDLTQVLKWASSMHLPVTMLGRGSNLLIREGGIRGVVISLSHSNFSHINVEGDRLIAGAGVRLKLVSETARKAGLSGLEFFEGIPGCVGGALRMNAGAMNSCAFEPLIQLTTMDRQGVIHHWDAEDVEARYRQCPLLEEHIALEAVFQGVPDDPDNIKRIMDEYGQRRKQSQPIASSAGCMFKNPTEIPAGKLIEELGLKGARIGDAMVSDIHGNFIVNRGHATSSDVLALIDQVRSRAKSECNIDLEVEVQVIGE
jgi:UDP-N-acetylmuramate--alanine ligase